MIIYTAIFDNYDNLHEPLVFIPDTEHICFSNYIRRNTKSAWRIKKVDLPLDGFRKNRYYKINCHKELPKDEIIVYIDPTFMVTKDFSHLVEKWLGNNDIALMNHPKRKTIYEEANYLIRAKPHKLDSIDIVKKQMDKFRTDGLIDDRVVQGGFIVRRNTKELGNLNKVWWDIVKNYSKRDQLSFSYASEKSGVGYSIIPREEVEEHTMRIAWHP